MPRPPSQTAAAVAIARAVADAGGTTTTGFRDPVAAALLSPGWRRLLRVAAFALPLVPALARPRAFAWIDAMVLRTLAIDAAVLDAAVGCPQIVVLGAGLDTRGWRLPLPETEVFEVDHPGTQAHKRTAIQDRAPTACRVAFVEADLETDALPKRLRGAGHRALAAMRSSVEAAGFTVEADTGTDAWTIPIPSTLVTLGVTNVQRLLRARG